MRGLIRLWQRQGKTIIAAEHRIAYLWDLIDRAVILREGRIVRELGQKEKEELSEEMLAAMGLRSIRQEAPDQIDLPTIKEGDREIILREFLLPVSRDPTAGLRIPGTAACRGENHGYHRHQRRWKDQFSLLPLRSGEALPGQAGN